MADSSKFRCVLTATLGMATVIWYTLGGHISDEEMEEEVQAKITAKEKRGRLFGLLKRQNVEQAS
jgi:iron transport multicopper oxidase